MSAARATAPHLPVTRRELTGALFLSLCAAGLYFVPDLPVSRLFCVVALSSFLLHLPIWVFFNRWTTHMGAIITVYNVVDAVILALAMHYTGGVLSPFTMAFVGILISDSAYGIHYAWGFIPIVAAYVGVVGLEAAGWLPSIPVTPAAVYRSHAYLALVVVNMVGILFAAGFLYKNLIALLSARIRQEEAEKQAAHERIAELEPRAQKSLVVARLTHDLRGYLTPVKGVLYQASRCSPEEAADLRFAARDALRVMARIESFAERLLAYSKRREDRPERVNLWELVEEVLKTARHVAGAETVDFHLCPLPLKPVVVMGYRDELERVYFNLAKNAVEALQRRPEPRELSVTVAAEDGRACVLLRDNGPGMEPALAAAVLKGGVSTKADGHGAGLVIAREGVAAHDGTLSLDTAPDRGAEIRTSFPSATEEP